MKEAKNNHIKVKVIEEGIILENVKDFNTKHIFECGQCFRWNKESDGSYTIVAYGKVINVKSDNNKIIILNTNIEDYNSIWYNYFDLGRDYYNIKQDLSKDPIMEKAIQYGNGIRILKQEPWETLISFIVSANNRISMISKSLNLLSKLYGQAIIYQGNTYYSFPTAESLAQLDVDDIRQCKAGFRCKYIKKAAEIINNGEIILEDIKHRDVSQGRKELIKIPGVGFKVADCILLFAVQKYSVYPIDVWVKRVTEHFYLSYDSKIDDIYEFARNNFGDLAGFAQQYLFYYAREEKIGKV